MDEFILDSVIHQVLSEFIMVVETQRVSHTMHLYTQHFSTDSLLGGVIHPQLRFTSRLHRCAFHHQVSCFSAISIHTMEFN